MSEPSANTELALQEQLVAYLDGELDADSSRRIEELLAADPAARQRLQLLDRTWQLLDELDATPVDERFAQTTLEMVTVAAAEEVEQTRAESPRRERRQWLLAAAGLAAAALAGFFGVAQLLPDPNGRLLEKLPVLENLSQYDEVRDFKFLRLLHDEKMFTERHDDGGRQTASAEESLAARRQRVEALSPAEKEQLRLRQERFESMTSAEQERLLKLHKEIAAEPNAAELHQIAQRYCLWLEKQPPYRKEEVLELEPKKRAQRVKALLAEQNVARRADPKDYQALQQWIEDYVARHEEDLLKALPDEEGRERLAKQPPAARRQWLVLWQRWQMASPGKLPPISERDLTELQSKFSAETQRWLAAIPPEEQWRAIAGWIRQAWGSRRMPGMAPGVDEDRLADFFEHDISEEDRDHLLNLPGEEMQRELGKLYFRHKFLGAGMQPPDGMGRGKRPGPPGVDSPYVRKRMEKGPPEPEKRGRPSTRPFGSPAEPPSGAP